MADIDIHMRAFNILSGIAEVPSDDADEPLYQNLPSDDADEPLYQNGLSEVANAFNIDDASNAADDSIPIKSGLVPAADSIPLKSGWVPASECAFSDNICDIPATMLYDFCNAFPTLLHEWMWLVLNVLKIPKQLLRVIECLYTSINAFSSGCGDGSFLFQVLGGAKTGCPLSSILFLLCCNPFIDLVMRLSDGPKLSVTRI